MRPARVSCALMFALYSATRSLSCAARSAGAARAGGARWDVPSSSLAAAGPSRDTRCPASGTSCTTRCRPAPRRISKQALCVSNPPAAQRAQGGAHLASYAACPVRKQRAVSVMDGSAREAPHTSSRPAQSCVCPWLRWARTEEACGASCPGRCLAPRT